MTAQIIPLAHYRTLRTRAYQPPIRYAPPPPDPAALAITCLLWWSAALCVVAQGIADIQADMRRGE